PNQLQNIKPGEFGHLHIEKNQIRLVFGERLDRFEAVRAFRQDFHFRMRSDKFADNVPREFFSVHDERTDFLWRRADCPSALDSSWIASTTCRRAPKRTFSMARKRSSSASSSESGIALFSPSPRVMRRNSESRMHMSRALAGSMLVSALMELRLLKRKWGLTCAFRAFNSASRARTRASLACVSARRDSSMAIST